MSSDENQNNNSGQPPKPTPDKPDTTQPRQPSATDAYFSKFNAILSKELGIPAEKMIELQLTKSPQEIFDILDNANALGLSGQQPRNPKGQFSSKTPPIPTYPQGNAADKLPGKSRGGEKLVKDEGFKLKRSFDPRLLFGSNKTTKK